MATIKSYTDINQSKKLAEILPLESADMCYRYYNGSTIKGYADCVLAKSFITEKNVIRENDLPCWSLAALLGILPEGYSFELTKCFNSIDYCCNLDGKDISTYANNPVDACVAMIEKLHELKLL